MQVVEHDEERPLRRKHFQVPTRGPLRLFLGPRDAADADRRREAIGDEIVPGESRDRISLRTRGRAHDLREVPRRGPALG